jgi:hypothetical protein
LAGKPVDGFELGFKAMSEFEGEGGFAASGHAGEAENDAGFEALVQEIDIGFTTDEERWARGQQIDAWRRGGVFSEEPGGDLAEACGMVAAEVKLAFVCGAGGGLAIAIEDAGEFGAAVVGLVSEGVGPLFFDPI